MKAETKELQNTIKVGGGRKRSAGTQGGTKPGHDNAQGIQLSSLTDMLESYTRELAVSMKQFATGTTVTLMTVLIVGYILDDVTRDDAKSHPYWEQERASHCLRNQSSKLCWISNSVIT